MATTLNKTLIRESTDVIDERNIIISITEDQKISLKLKGMKSGAVEISILDLYKQLAGVESDDEAEVEVKEKKSAPVVIDHSRKRKADDDTPLINMNDFRSQYLISASIPLDIKLKLERITVNLIKNLKK